MQYRIIKGTLNDIYRVQYKPKLFPFWFTVKHTPIMHGSSIPHDFYTKEEALKCIQERSVKIKNNKQKWEVLK